MSMTTLDKAQHERAQGRRDAITSALGVALAGGVFTDGWAHVNRPGLETFITPWPAILYAGLTAAADALRWPVSLWSGVVLLSAPITAATGFATTPTKEVSA